MQINAAPMPSRAVCEQDGRGALCLLLAGSNAGFAPAGFGRLGFFSRIRVRHVGGVSLPAPKAHACAAGTRLAPQ